MKFSSHRRNILVVVFAFVLAVPPMTVAAEDTRYSSMYDVLPGFNFRNFYDSNSDAVLSFVTLGGCYTQYPGGAAPVSIGLWEVRSLKPDIPEGSRGFQYCVTSNTQRWYDMSAGTYHFTLENYNNSSSWNKMSAPTTNYGW